MKKNITRKDWEYIGKYNPAAKWLRPLCSYTLEEIEEILGDIIFEDRRERQMGW